MKTSCVEVTYIAGLFTAVMVGLVGFLAPYWQVDEMLTSDNRHVEIAVGLSYACVKENKGNGKYNTFCKPLPAYGERSTENNLYIVAVRWLMTCHMFFMIVNTTLNMSSVCMSNKQIIRKYAAIVAFLSIASGMTGLALFNVKIEVYQHVFEKEFPEVMILELLVPGASFYLSSASLSLFGLICFVELVLRLRQFYENTRRNQERKTLLRDEIRFVYGSAPFFLSASASENNRQTMTSRVEACRVDIFGGGPLPVHDNDNRGRASHVWCSWRASKR